MADRYLSRAWPPRGAGYEQSSVWLRLRTFVSVRDLRNRRSLPIGARPLALHLVLGRANTTRYRRSLRPYETRFTPFAKLGCFSFFRTDFASSDVRPSGRTRPQACTNPDTSSQA